MKSIQVASRFRVLNQRQMHHASHQDISKLWVYASEPFCVLKAMEIASPGSIPRHDNMQAITRYQINEACNMRAANGYEIVTVCKPLVNMKS
jgi:hypothetical protein